MVHLIFSGVDITEPWIVAPYIAKVLAEESWVIYNPTDISLLKVATNRFQRARFMKYLSGRRRRMVLEPEAGMVVNYGGVNVDFGTRRVALLEKQIRRKAELLRKNFLKETPDSKIVVWCFEPYCALLKEVFPLSSLIYYIVDDFQSYSGARVNQVEHAHSRMLRMADHVVVVSQFLQEMIKPVRSDVMLQYLGAPTSVKRRKSHDATGSNRFVAEKKRKTIGMVGTFGDHVNIALLSELALSLSSYDFKFVGTIQPNVERQVQELLTQPNVSHLGVVHYSNVLDFVDSLDVCLLPFIRNDLTRASDPSKVYEYLARGKPVIATKINEDLQRYGELIYVCNEDEFRAVIKNLDHTENDMLVQRRREFIQNNTWYEVVENVLRVTNIKRGES